MRVPGRIRAVGAVSALLLGVLAAGAPAQAATPTVAVGMATMAKGKAPVLTDAAGMTLYTFRKDKAGKVACTGSCAKIWPPLLLAKGAPVAGPGVLGKLTVVEGGNGRQVVYDGHPLYTYVGDKKAGDAAGEGKFGLWFVAVPPAVQVGTAKVSGHAQFVLTNALGSTLYWFKPDTATKATCTGKCAALWPPLLQPVGAPARGSGALGHLAALSGADGRQVVYEGHPLYTFASDHKPGEAAGQGLFGKWFVAVPPLVQVGRANVSGKAEAVLVDPAGMTLYVYKPDTATKVACTGKCATLWPPLLSPAGVPTAAAGVKGALSVLKGADGPQVLDGGHPLYTFGGDKAPGQAKGQGLLGKWQVATPTMKALAAAKKTTTSTTTTTTSGGSTWA